MNADIPACADGIRRGYPVETPLGTMYLRHVGWGTIVDNSSSTMPHRDGRPYLTVRGRQLTATIGIDDDGRLERFYATGRNGKDATAAQRQALIATARVAVDEWTLANPERVSDARYHAARLDHERTVTALTLAREAYDDARKRERSARRARDRAAASLHSV